MRISSSVIKPIMPSRIYAMLFLFAVVIGHVSCKDNNEKNPAVFVANLEVLGVDIETGTLRQMSVVILPENATDKSVSWESSDPAVATVSGSGLVTAMKNGTVNIKATANDKGTVTGTKVLTISSFDDADAVPGRTVVKNTEELLDALAAVQAGDSIIMQGGIYSFTSKIIVNKSGKVDANITLTSVDGERVKWDFSALPESSSNQGMILDADFWHIKGIDYFKAGDNGLKIQGSNNIIEFCTFSECADTGLQIDSGGANNTILNCDSYFNADAQIENADGFACKLTAGSGNRFIGCRAWQNLDDGWDGYLRGADNIRTTYENCWSIKNGLLKDGSTGGGDGNGFKTGGSDDKLLKHNAKYTNCVAVGNVADGFDHNSNRGTVTMYNCAAYNNGRNLNFSNTNPLEKLILKNCAVLGALGSTNASATDISNNSWMNGLTVTEEDFQSIDPNQLIAARKADGSLPDVAFMHLVPTSDLIDQGVDVGLLYTGTAPDVGAFEYQ